MVKISTKEIITTEQKYTNIGKNFTSIFNTTKDYDDRINMYTNIV